MGNMPERTWWLRSCCDSRKSAEPDKPISRLPSSHSAILLKATLTELLEQGIPCYAECGGLMYLCQSILDMSGEVLPMVGAIARQSVMRRDRSGLVIGYREATALRDTLLTHQGEVVRGHEFHFSCLDAPPTREEGAYELTDRGQVEGFVRGNLLATYVHLSLGGFPLAAQRFVAAARSWQEQGYE